MRFILILVYSFALLGTLHAQVSMDAVSSSAWEDLRRIAEDGTPDEKLLLPYPVYKIRGQWYISLFGRLRENPSWKRLEASGALRGSETGAIGTIKIPLSAMDECHLEDVFAYVELPKRVHPDLNRVRYDVHVDSVYMGTELPGSFTGKDVLIGVTDWGFDYTHPMFYDTLMQETRIVAAWDQFKQSGDSPESFGYGVEYQGADELLAAQSDTANIYSFATHGTHVAGIAGGSGAGLDFRGMAPEAGFLFTTFLIDAASVIDGFNWMHEKALEQDKRLVINMSWGLHYFGTLDGNSLLSQAIEELTEEGVVFVSSAGNNGDVNFHLQKDFSNDTITSRIQFESYSFPTMWGQSITMWGEAGHPFKAKLRILSGTNQLLAETGLYSTETAPAYLDSILVATDDTLLFNLTTDAAHPLNGRPHFRLRVKNPFTSYKVVLLSTAEDGTVHYWNVVELTNGVGNWGMGFLNPGGTTGVAGNPDYGISEPACGSAVIAVAAYTARYLNNQGNLIGGQVAGFTSFGPLINGVIKPDISAPGVSVASSISYFTDNSYSTTESVEFNGLEYDFARFSGTSMSSPCVAGIVALMLDANPGLSPEQIRDILQSTARTDEYTGTINPPGDVRWGYGKVNAYQAVKTALETVSISEPNNHSVEIALYPNPVSELLFVTIPADESVLRIRAIDMSGRIFELSYLSGHVRVDHLGNGAYMIEIITTRGIYRSSVICQ